LTGTKNVEHQTQAAAATPSRLWQLLRGIELDFASPAMVDHPVGYDLASTFTEREAEPAL